MPRVAEQARGDTFCLSAGERVSLSKEAILGFLRESKPELERRFAVRSIGLFGSFVHDIPNQSSDVDILVELAEPTFDHYMGLKSHLEEQFQRPIDLVLADTVKPRLKPIINREVEYA